MKRVTADTLTDEQIEHVRRALIGVKRKNAHHRALLKDCQGADQGSSACRESVTREYNKMLGLIVTAVTITDEQIHELLDSSRIFIDRAWCHAALRIPVGKRAKSDRMKARARCAELLNTRNGGE